MQWNDSIIAFQSAHKIVSRIHKQTLHTYHHVCYERYSTSINSSAVSLSVLMPWKNTDGKLCIT